MHVAALALAQAGDFAEHLGGHGVQRHALGNREVVGAVGADHGVVRGQMRADANGHRFLASGQMHLARDRAGANVKGQTLLDIRGQFALHVDRRHGLFVKADLDHLLVHPEQFFFAGLHGSLL